MARKTHTETHIGTDTVIDLRHRRHRPRRVARHAGGDDRGPHMSVVRAVAKTALAPGTVVWAHIPYEEPGEYKLRPAVVIARCGRDVTVYPATSSASRHRYPWCYQEISDLDAAGLARATGMRLVPVTIDLIDVVAVLGALGDDDRLPVPAGPAAATVAA
jgi:hypothetical protein